MCKTWYNSRKTNFGKTVWRKLLHKNGLIKRPTYGKKKPPTKISCAIGEFHMTYYQTMFKKYAYHRILLCLPGKL